MALTDTSRPVTARRLDRRGSLLLVLGGVAFFAYGPLHPKGSDRGDKTMQLHSMLVDDMWYPSHAVGLLAFGAFAAGLLMIAHAGGLPAGVARATRVVGVLSVVMTLGQLVHTLAATQAPHLETGGMTPMLGLFVGVETVLNPVWALGIAVLAVVGGVGRTLGNRLVLAVGLLGGLAFALANATIAFTDVFDPLFPVAGLIGIWAVAVGVIALVRPVPATA